MLQIILEDYNIILSLGGILTMEELFFNIKNNLKQATSNNEGVAVIEVILILVVLIGLVVVFKSQASSLLTTIWNAVTEGASSVTGK